MIYDCFSFFNEFDILEIRLNVLSPIVDKFVLVEATRRHSGEPKDLFYDKNKKRFSKFQDKIIHVKVYDAPSLPEDCPKLIASWAYENHQRNAIVKGLIDVNDDDVIIISDLDEIPDPKLIAKYAAKCEGVIGFDNYLFYYYLNFKSMNNPHWPGSKMLKWKVFNDATRFSNMSHHIPMPEFVNKGVTATRVRFLNPDKWIRGGWHFSYFGGAQQIQLKLRSIADNVCDPARNISIDDIKKHISEGKDPLGRGGKFYPVPLDESFPDYILVNKDRYSEGILPCKSVSLWIRGLCVIERTKTVVLQFVAGHVPRFLKPMIHMLYRRCVKNPIPLMRDQLSERSGE